MRSSLVPKTFRSLITSLVLLCAASLAHGQSATITVTPTLTAVTAPGAATEITVVQASGTPSAFSVYGPNQTRLSSLISGSTYRFTPQRGATVFTAGQLIGYVSIPTGSLSFTVRVSVAPKLVDPVFIGDSGSGGYPGLVPAPAAGDAAAGKFVKADGTFAVPPGSASEVRTLQFAINNGGVVPSTGIYSQISVPYNCTITGWVVTADQSGSAVIDVLRSTYAGFPTTASIAGTDKPTLSSVQKNHNLGPLSSWGSTAITAGDVLQINLNSATTVTALYLTLNITVP